MAKTDGIDYDKDKVVVKLVGAILTINDSEKKEEPAKVDGKEADKKDADKKLEEKKDDKKGCCCSIF